MICSLLNKQGQFKSLGFSILQFKIDLRIEKVHKKTLRGNKYYYKKNMLEYELF